MKALYKKLTQTQMIAYGYLAVILGGTFILMLPFSSKAGTFTSFWDALFTAVSASCVTGLVVVDTFTYWSLFGQLVILFLIQIGGLGFMTIGVFFAILLRRKIGLRTRGILQESVNTLQIGGIVRLARRIMYGTLLFELIGTILLSIRFVPRFGFWKGIYFGAFHSISAFCNAGFDLMGGGAPYQSMVEYSGDLLVNVTIMSLIVIGGIGFFVWNDIYAKKWHVKTYKLHTKIVLTTTAFLIVMGAVLFYIFEKNHILAGVDTKEAVLSSLFNSITARTAGFNTTDTAALCEKTQFLTILLMFVGGSPGSTAGGIKTTTLVVLIAYMGTNLRGEKNCNIYNRRLDEDTIRKASTVLCTNLFLTILAILCISGIEDIPLTQIAFEVVSAIGTVGMTTGITRELHLASRLILIFLMYCGRIGSLTFALSLKGHRQNVPVVQPIEQITIG